MYVGLEDQGYVPQALPEVSEVGNADAGHHEAPDPSPQVSEVRPRVPGHPRDDIGGGDDGGTAETLRDVRLPFLDAGDPDGTEVIDEDGGDPAWAFLHADARRLGYTHSQRGCGCGKHWDDYCRAFGIIGDRALRSIRKHELQWDMERE